MQTKEWPIGTRNCQLRDWASFEAEVAESIHLLAIKDDRYICLTCRKTKRYVQFISLDSGSIRGEVVGNHFLDQKHQLSASTCRQLGQLGWKSPGPAETADKNHWFLWDHPAPIRRIASLTVKTLRDGLRISSPHELEIRQGSFESCPLTVSVETGEWIPAAEDSGLRLRVGVMVRNFFTGRQYRVGKRLGAGGFGAAYQVTQSGNEPAFGECCLKVASEPSGWHREAYFGDLLKEVPGVVKVMSLSLGRHQGRIATRCIAW
jgi:hypothetical protein